MVATDPAACHIQGMTDKRKRPRDTSQLAKVVVDIATGQIEDREIVPGEHEKDPAMAAGVPDRLWEIGDIVKLVEDAEPKLDKRGSYTKKNTN